MDPARWRRVDELFNAAVDQPEAQRAAFLDRACGGDVELRAQVESLLASDREDGFLDEPAAGEAARAVAASARRESLIGRRLGPYEIVAPLGAGGMGEVYRAKDTRLDRSVAIKVMPAHLAADPEARQRFDREARAISALAHPHICALHDVGSQDGVDFLVMELVDGETLAARLGRGPVPLLDALRWAAQIAEALAQAHRAGIVHRDLKPANVMLTRGGVKLLDFGLARRSPPLAEGQATRRLNRSAAPLTAAGTILGTLHYMAPEQLEGRPVDSRADLFSFGAMLYELVTGARAFDGETPASVISSILRDRPAPVSSRRALAPPALDALVEHCLAKDVEARWQSAHDLHLQLFGIAAETATPRTATPAGRRWLPWAVAAAAVAIAAGVGAVALRRPPAQPAPAVRFELPHPAGGRFYYSPETSSLALSPDGASLAFIDAGAASGPTAIAIRPLAELAARPLAGTEGATSLFWSPDGEHIGFFAGGKLKRVPIAGGTPLVLCDVTTGSGVTGTWGRDAILFAAIHEDLVYRVPVDGGAPSEALKADAARGERRLSWPWFLPDGERYLYLVYRDDGTSELRLAGPREAPRSVTPLASRVEVVGPDHMVFVRDGALLAQRFDADRAQLHGAPVPLVPTVRGFGSTGAAAFATSRTGTVVVATWNDQHRVAAFAPDGRPVEADGGGEGAAGRGSAVSLALSPDGRRALVDRLRPDLLTYDVWLLDLRRGTENRLTDAPGTDVYPVWLPGGSTIVYSASRLNAPNLVRRDLATGREQWLTPPEGLQVAAAVTPDGRRLLYRQRRGSGFELMAVPLQGGGPPVPVLRPGVVVGDATLSPDGRLLAYVSREGSRPELFVRHLDGGGESLRVSRDGAWTARFSRDGATLFFVDGNRRLAAASVTTSPALDVGVPVVRFDLPRLSWLDFDVLADGRFVALVREVDGTETPLTVITGWNARP